VALNPPLLLGLLGRSILSLWTNGTESGSCCTPAVELCKPPVDSIASPKTNFQCSLEAVRDAKCELVTCLEVHAGHDIARGLSHPKIESELG
jgi:hypothetical protein